jgi:hypothetical protein
MKALRKDTHKSEHTGADIEVRERAPQQHQRQTLETQNKKKRKTPCHNGVGMVVIVHI